MVSLERALSQGWTKTADFKWEERRTDPNTRINQILSSLVWVGDKNWISLKVFSTTFCRCPRAP